jgi:hypothetical protein
MRVDEVRYVKRDSMIAGALVAVIAALLALWTSGILIVFGVIAVVLGVLLSLTVIGALIGIPLAFVGLLGLLAGIITGTGGVTFAVLFGLGCGYVYYRYRMRSLTGYRAGRLTP